MTKRKVLEGVNLLLALILVCSCVPFVGCSNNDDLVWTNGNAVYAYVKAGFENDILKDVEGAFESLHFQRVYITEKNINQWTPLTLLFVLEENETDNQQEFISLLKQDERINHASICRDISFETVDTRYI